MEKSRAHAPWSIRSLDDLKGRLPRTLVLRLTPQEWAKTARGTVPRRSAKRHGLGLLAIPDPERAGGALMMPNCGEPSSSKSCVATPRRVGWMIVWECRCHWTVDPPGRTRTGGGTLPGMRLPCIVGFDARTLGMTCLNVKCLGKCKLVGTRKKLGAAQSPGAVIFATALLYECKCSA